MAHADSCLKSWSFASQVRGSRCFAHLRAPHAEDKDGPWLGDKASGDRAKLWADRAFTSNRDEEMGTPERATLLFDVLDLLCGRTAWSFDTQPAPPALADGAGVAGTTVVTPADASAPPQPTFEVGTRLNWVNDSGTACSGALIRTIGDFAFVRLDDGEKFTFLHVALCCYSYSSALQVL